jgi:hypothetical protein
VASFPGQKSTGPPLPNQVTGVVATLVGGSATVPGAPTIGTATAGNANATVSFTAPASNGGSPITGYTATASPGGLAASGASSPLTVTGLTNGTAYTFTVVATNAVGNSAPSAASNSVTPSASGTPPSAPIRLQSILEGQTQQAQGIYQQPINGNLDFMPQNQNTRTLAWLNPTPSGSQAALASNRVYRSDNPTVVYATVPVATGASNYATYVANSANTTPGSGGTPGPWPYQVLVDHAYTDSACMTAAGYPQGAGPDFYPGNSLQYQVTAVDVNGLESAKSANMIKWYMSNGVLITCGGTFNGSMTPGATDGGTNPLTGNSAAVKWVTAGANDLINPFFDFGDTRWSGNLAPFTTLNLYVKASTSVGLQIHALRRIPTGSGDQDILASAGNNLTVPVGTATTSWQLFPISLASIQTDYLDGQQTTGYKWDLQITTGGAGISLWLEWSFS